MQGSIAGESELARGPYANICRGAIHGITLEGRVEEDSVRRHVHHCSKRRMAAVIELIAAPLGIGAPIHSDQAEPRSSRCWETKSWACQTIVQKKKGRFLVDFPPGLRNEQSYPTVSSPAMALAETHPGKAGSRRKRRARLHFHRVVGVGNNMERKRGG